MDDVVFNAYSSEKQTFFIISNIMFKYISNIKMLTNSELHLIGITYIFIVSQFKDLFPIEMND